MLGTDFMHGASFMQKEETLVTLASIFAQLPLAVAEAIAHGNAERLFKLKPP